MALKASNPFIAMDLRSECFLKSQRTQQAWAQLSQGYEVTVTAIGCEDGHCSSGPWHPMSKDPRSICWRGGCDLERIAWP